MQLGWESALLGMLEPRVCAWVLVWVYLGKPHPNRLSPLTYTGVNPAPLQPRKG